MTVLAELPRSEIDLACRPIWQPWIGVGVIAICVAALAGCSAQPTRYASGGFGGRSLDPLLGVYASPRLYADGDPIPRGGGKYLIGRPYTVAGRAYYPNPNPEGYTVVGTASWYGDAFHGRRTANGEIFDKNSISAAHPTLPLPSYVRVTNLGNGRSMIVRVNDRGPYHGGRVMDVSQRVAETLDFRRAGTARIKVDYVGRAGIGGSDDNKLLATLRMDGPAHLDGTSDEPTMLADQGDGGGLPPAPSPSPMPAPLAQAARPLESDEPSGDAAQPVLRPESPYRRRLRTPMPPQRPYEVGDGSDPGRGDGMDASPEGSGLTRQVRASPPRAAAAVPAPTPPPTISFAATEPVPPARPRFPTAGRRPPAVPNEDDPGN